MNLIDKIRDLPKSAGIYQFFDKDNKLLYIGKAKVLKNRVKSYFKFTPTLSPSPNLSARIYNMIQNTSSLEYIVVENEHDALILENSLIKQLKPKYNILLRDDKTYPYIYVDLNQDFPRLEITRKVITKAKIKYYGPFSTSAKDILDSIYEIFPLVQKKGSLKNKKACLFYQINRCKAPCEGKISKEEYKEILDQAMSMLHDKKELIKRLTKKMQSYSDRLLFEEALILRDRIERIKKSTIFTSIDIAKNEDLDLFYTLIQDTKACLVKLFIRDGKIISSSHNITKSDNGFDIDELYKRALLEHYSLDLPTVAKSVILNEEFSEMELVCKTVSKRVGKRINFIVPKKGDKKNLLNLAKKNALELLRVDDKKSDDNLLVQIKELLNLDKTPFIIEAYDNSHMQGSGIVGAMIKWSGKFIKSEYRHYNLSYKDEYSQMRELIQKRCDSFYKNPPPDLMIIDGGDTLLQLALKIVKQSRTFVDIIAISKEKKDLKSIRAKGGAHDILYTKDEIFKLPPNDKRLQFIQKLRDEAHRFALKFHQKQKLKADTQIKLLEQKGIAEATIKKLILYFETFENVQNASFEELNAVVGTKIAKSIKSMKEKE